MSRTIEKSKVNVEYLLTLPKNTWWAMSPSRVNFQYKNGEYWFRPSFIQSLCGRFNVEELEAIIIKLKELNKNEKKI